MNAATTPFARRRRHSDRTDPPPSEPLDRLDDADLLRHPDRHAAFTALYDRYAPRVIGYCRARIANESDAEETAAQVLAKAWAGFPPDHRGTFRAWLFTVAHHTIVDYYRQASRTPSFASESALLTLESSVPPPDEASIAAETRTELVAAIASLPADQQQAITLRVAGLKGREVAEVMGRSNEAIKMLQFRAITTLRTLLATAPDGEEAFR